MLSIEQAKQLTNGLSEDAFLAEVDNALKRLITLTDAAVCEYSAGYVVGRFVSETKDLSAFVSAYRKKKGGQSSIKVL